jgi:hypothetical protein
MPAVCKCRVPDCTFDGNHGFTSTVGGVEMFYHTEATKETHFWYMVGLDRHSRRDLIKVGTVEQITDGREFLYTTDKLEAFNVAVAPTSRSDIWTDAWRARLSGNEPLANRLFKRWQQQNETHAERQARLSRSAR